MAGARKRKDQFANVVRAEMKRQGLGTRTLARKIVGPDATLNQIDNMRGLVRDWISEPQRHSPSRTSRERVADALGIPRDRLVDPDDEEDHLVAELLRTIQKLQKAQRQRELVGGRS